VANSRWQRLSEKLKATSVFLCRTILFLSGFEGREVEAFMQADMLSKHERRTRYTGIRWQSIDRTSLGFARYLLRSSWVFSATVIGTAVAKRWRSHTHDINQYDREENARLRDRIEDLENDALAVSERIALAESRLKEKDAALKQLTIERDDLVRSLGALQSALRNAEADVRAARRTIDGFERNRREDREQIRDLQKRIEDLIGEIAGLKAKASSAAQRELPRGAGSSRSRGS
jgi:hypothetical protein